MSQAHDSINTVGEVINDQAKGFRALGLLVAELGFSIVMPLLRRNLGERYFSPFLIIVMAAFAFSMSHILKVSPAIITIYIIILAVVSVIHLFVINRRNAHDDQWHTRYQGDFLPFFSKLPKGNNYWFVEGVYEPAFVFICGLLIQLFLDVGLGSLFMFSALWMVTRSRFLYWMYRQQILDERDALIESEYKLDAINGKPPAQTKGFIVKNANGMKPNDKKAVARSLLNEKDFSQIVT